MIGKNSPILGFSRGFLCSYFGGSGYARILWSVSVTIRNEALPRALRFLTARRYVFCPPFTQRNGEPTGSTETVLLADHSTVMATWPL